jgi:small subunit ribosomal protein S15
MARMHARRKGASSSTRPFRLKNPEWVTLSKEEIADVVVKLSKEGLSPSVIGMRLRDQYGVPDVKLATNKSITKILLEKGIKIDMPEDLRALLKRVVSLNNHLASHPKDMHNKRRMQLVESKIRRLTRYYQETGKVDSTWKYSIDTAKLLVE